ncbi:protein MpUGT4 [Marchantia polymorpha subsp. ruderalis]|uniref:Glycosyltransferase n=2 Tax=Marchantia polymorpha TaxID=3197 RepID=A0A176VYL1_MARPO|nr:hypothetical protein AXG93_2145s1990 [Marchantia polymorpha subsp. ruderalis]PTQ34142.1 hypothetical protein MARPO_0082s0001 [Marchantia polymorpha]BBN02398.1 hypothetical protein Mp_2g15040 [Marchantia polymorpha subsp. ruderalis]|eukprot:PTQ34142.1 hypothetical protein MARPO_0082s0001 [Marchantia polymorpha]
MESSRNENDASRILDVWMVPLPFFSHVVCFSHFAQKLARQGLRVTFFANNDDINRLKSSPNRSWKLDGLDIHFRALDMQAAALADGVGGCERFVGPFEQAEGAFAAILRNELEGGSKPDYVIADYFVLHGITETTNLYKIPACVYFTCSSGYLAGSAYINELILEGLFNIPGSYMDPKALREVISVPGQPLMKLFELGDENYVDAPLYHRRVKNLDALIKLDVVLLSCFEELEEQSLQGLASVLNACAAKKGRKMPHIWPVGPAFSFISVGNSRESQQDDHPCLKFLDKHPPSSVVYVAFGNDVNLPLEQIHELIYGLESSQQPFLCALQPPSNESNPDQVQEIESILPAEFLARTAGRGMFVKWAPQIEVLSHPSTGGFITHCGQNSVLESVSKGVPILAWPFLYDQFQNARYLVDGARIAVEVCPGVIPGQLVDRKQLESSINTLFRTDEGAALRKRALQMKLKAEETVGPNGSSTKNMQAFLQVIRAGASSKIELSNLQLK